MRKYIINSDDALLSYGLTKIIGILEKGSQVMSHKDWLEWGSKEKTARNSVIFIHYFHRYTDVRLMYRSLIKANRVKKTSGQIILVDEMEEVFKAMSDVLRNLVVLKSDCTPEALMLNLVNLRECTASTSSGALCNLPEFGLSPAQINVALKLGAGMSQIYAGKMCNLTKKTVSTHKRHIFKKLRLRNHFDFYRLTLLINESSRV
ncbi:LuxR C-terminal-related transcriptional regulator (plasmid) [Pantoea sp. BJ2]|uniref:LuxR C-terminal-related transcriptional regulator n=1 Tax=Pantoea sp. BJ2 TaxID=3141322 RepID=A0AAU7U3I8_9GAMM